jgi:putative membrane protein
METNLVHGIDQATNLERENPMHAAAQIAVVAVALLHVYFLILEMFLWEKPAGLRAFGLTPEVAQITKTLAANQGLYNGFLAAGLIWGLLQGHAGNDVLLFFLGCVVSAGLYGAVTASQKILWIQAMPGATALALVLIAK